MSRFEFIEGIVRAGQQRYSNTDLMAPDEALKLMISHIKQKIDLSNWKPWRVNQLWTLEIDDFLKANLQSLTKVYQSYWSDIQKFMNYSQA